jgi:hypothetical protein
MDRKRKEKKRRRREWPCSPLSPPSSHCDRTDCASLTVSLRDPHVCCRLGAREPGEGEGD